MIKQYLLTLLFLFGVSTSLFAQDATKKVAVYMAETNVDDAFKKVIGSKLVSAITSTSDYSAVERTQDFLDAIYNEHSFQHSGEVRDSQIVSLGKKYGVRYVVVVDMSEVFDDLFIAARLINIETGKIDKSVEVNGTAESTQQLIDLADKIAQALFKNSNHNNNTEEIHTSAQIIAEFPGGQGALMRFISQNVNYPTQCVNSHIEGRVIVKAAIMKDGSIGPVEIAKSVHPLLDEEALRIVKLMPRWAPASNNGQTINSWFLIPINFKLPSN